MTSKEIIEKLRKLLNEAYVEYEKATPNKWRIYNDFDGLTELTLDSLKEEGLGEMIVEEDKRSGDDYDEWHRVVYFPKHDIYICHIGHYNSEDGHYYEETREYDLFEVKKKEIMTTCFYPVRD